MNEENKVQGIHRLKDYITLFIQSSKTDKTKLILRYVQLVYGVYDKEIDIF